ncbi:hypothetical protein G9A89_017313 [Geosiphon pyriformis]|nr:hypothetical protein G9A89_017313 [Geosiphon pyriformis]
MTLSIRNSEIFRAIKKIERDLEIMGQNVHNKSKLFLLNYETTVGSSIAVLNKSIIEPSFNIGVKSVKFRKKKRDSVLKNDISNRKITIAKKSSSHSWGFETDNTTELNSMDIEKECLVEETSFNYEEDRALASKDSEQTPKGSKILTKRALGKPLEKINFLDNDDNDILLDILLTFLPFLKTQVNIPVRKSFALDIGLDKVVGKFSQKKLQVVKKLFSRINDFREVSTPSKFAGIIRALFIFKSSLAQTSKKTEDMKILVNTDLKKSTGCLDWAVVIKKIPVGTSAEAVRTVLSKFEIIKSIKMQLVGLWQKAIVKFEQIDHADLVTTK